MKISRSTVTIATCMLWNWILVHHLRSGCLCSNSGKVLRPFLWWWPLHQKPQLPLFPRDSFLERVLPFLYCQVVPDYIPSQPWSSPPQSQTVPALGTISWCDCDLCQNNRFPAPNLLHLKYPARWSWIVATYGDIKHLLFYPQAQLCSFFDCCHSLISFFFWVSHHTQLRLEPPQVHAKLRRFSN